MLILNLEWKIWARITSPSCRTKVTGFNLNTLADPSTSLAPRVKHPDPLGCLDQPLLSLRMAEAMNAGAWAHCADIKAKIHQLLMKWTVTGRSSSRRAAVALGHSSTWAHDQTKPRSPFTSPGKNLCATCPSPNSPTWILGARENRETGAGQRVGVVGI